MVDYLQRYWGGYGKDRPELVVQTLETAVRHGYELRAHNVPVTNAVRLQAVIAAGAESIAAVPADTLVVGWGGNSHTHAEYGVDARLEGTVITVDWNSDIYGGPTRPDHVYFNTTEPNASDFVADVRSMGQVVPGKVVTVGPGHPI